MKRFFVLLFILVAFINMFALGMQRGDSPITNTLDVKVNIPLKVGINMTGTDIEFDLDDASVVYPADAFPAYFTPTNVTSANVPLDVFCNASTGWELTVLASGDFDVSLPVSQLFYGDAGSAITSDGTATPGADWIAFSSGSASTVASDVAKTTGWDSYDQDYMLQLLGTEEPFDNTVTITYTITAL